MKPNNREIKQAAKVIENAINKKHWQVMIRTEAPTQGNEANGTFFEMLLVSKDKKRKIGIWKHRPDNK